MPGSAGHFCLLGTHRCLTNPILYDIKNSISSLKGMMSFGDNPFGYRGIGHLRVLDQTCLVRRSAGDPQRGFVNTVYQIPASSRQDWV